MTASEVLTNEQIETIKNTVGTDRNDLLNKVAEYLNSSLVNTTVYVKSSTKIAYNGYQVDLSTRKVKNQQVIKSVFVQNLKEYTDITGYYF